MGFFFGGPFKVLFHLRTFSADLAPDPSCWQRLLKINLNLLDAVEFTKYMYFGLCAFKFNVCVKSMCIQIQYVCKFNVCVSSKCVQVQC